MGIDVVGGIVFAVGLSGQTTTMTYYGGYNYTYSESDLTLSYISLAVIFANDIWSLIDAPVSANAINRRNRFGLNYQLNKNINVTLKPDYKIDNYSGRYTPVIGAKLVFNLN